MQELKPSTPLQGGEYRIKRKLGQGGFGITYLAEQVLLKREIAIKEFFMKDNCVRDAQTGQVSVPTTGSAVQVERYRNKFLKEAQSLATMSHPHIITVMDLFERNGTVYYSMPYLPNGSLKELVEREGRLSEEKAVRYVSQIASALKYMHEMRHTCHLDVKPANILLDNNKNAILIDFGICKSYDRNGKETSSTPVGISEGYAPIEQYAQQMDEFSPASDIYALGATLYFLVMGKTPPSAISLTQGEELSFDNCVSQPVRDLIKQSMAVVAKYRPQNVDGFLVISVTEDSEKTEVPVYDDEKDSNQDGQDETILDDESKQKKPAIDNKIIKQLIDNMVPVLGGSFYMGANNSLFYSDNSPKHPVILSSFKICKYQVTQELWMAVMGDNPSKFIGNKYLPVEQVSWYDCEKFISKLNRITGMSFRLPTEAEWEYAASERKKESKHKYSGSAFIEKVAWYDKNSNRGTHRVGSKEPNALGLYDMSGNVWEWCQDWYGSYTSDLENNPCGGEQGSQKVMRGGSWKSSSDNCRIKQRGRLEPSHTDNDLGFRLVLSNN